MAGTVNNVRTIKNSVIDIWNYIFRRKIWSESTLIFNSTRCYTFSGMSELFNKFFREPNAKLAVSVERLAPGNDLTVDDYANRV